MAWKQSWRWGLTAAMGLSLSAMAWADPSAISLNNPNGPSAGGFSVAAGGIGGMVGGMVGGAVGGVDQAVSDLDPLTVGMRRVEPGIKIDDGEHTLLYAVYSPDMPSALSPVMKYGQLMPMPVYYRMGQGFRARMDRMDYLIQIDRRHYESNVSPKVDGRFIEVAPANMVFDLRPLPAGLPGSSQPVGASPQLSGSSASSSPDYRVQGQASQGPIDGRVNGRVNGQR